MYCGYLCTINAILRFDIISISLSSHLRYGKLLRIRAAQTVMKEAESGGGDMEVKGAEEEDPPQLDDDQIVSMMGGLALFSAPLQ